MAATKNPYPTDGETIVLCAGADYRNADERAITWTAPAGLPDLTTATAIKFTIDGALQVDAVARTATEVTVDLTAAQTSGLTVKRYTWALDATINDHSVPLARGFLVVKPAPST